MSNHLSLDSAQFFLSEAAACNSIFHSTLYENVKELLVFKERLLKLKEFAMTLPEDRVNMDFWRENRAAKVRRINSPGVVYARSVYDVTDEELKTDCGTSACILGWLASDSHHQSQGWSAKVEREGHGVIVVYKHPQTGSERYGYPAAATYFGLADDTASNLFRPVWNTSLPELATFLQRLQVVLEHVEELVKEAEA